MNNREEMLYPSGIGYLIVNVFTARGAVPIKNAVVVIYGIDEYEKNTVLYSMTTDSIGAAEKVSLAAPSELQVLSCKYPNPYTSYNIEIYKDGYCCSENISVQIFENVTTVCQAELNSLI